MSTVNTSFCEELFYSDCLLDVSNNNTVFLLVCFLLSNQNKTKYLLNTKCGRANSSTSWVLGLTLSNRQTRRPRIVNICSLFCY